MWYEWVRKKDWEHIVYMVYDWNNSTETNWKEIFDFIDRWVKKDFGNHYFRNGIASINLVWDDTLQEFIPLKIWYHIIIDTSWHVRIFNQQTFERFYEKFVPENIEYVFFNW